MITDPFIGVDVLSAEVESDVMESSSLSVSTVSDVAAVRVELRLQRNGIVLDVSVLLGSQLLKTRREID